MSDKLEVLGKNVRHSLKQLEVFDAPPHVTSVTMRSEELTSLCPVTAQPDFGSVEVVYAPDELCIESKSFKLYLWSFREEGHFCEALSQIILEEVVRAASPQYCRVTVTQNVRGGVTIKAVSEEGDRVDL